MLSRLGWECGLRCFLPTRRWLLSYWPPSWSLALIMALVRRYKEGGRIVPPWQTKPSQLGHFSRRSTRTLKDCSFVSRSGQNAPFLQTADCIEGGGDQCPLLQTRQCVPQPGQAYPPVQNAIPGY